MTLGGGGPQAAGALVVCATPIGNLGDASPRLAQELGRADVVACEDTRVAGKLLAHLGLRVRLVNYREHNEQDRARELADQIADGARVALMSDAGMPAISDPGYRLVHECVERELHVEVVPGPSAVIAALAVSGLPTDRFCFEGFLPHGAGARRRRLGALVGEVRTMVFYEAPHRVLATLSDMAEAFGPQRPCAVARELTKLYEEVLRGSLEAVGGQLLAQGPRGEFTLVIGGAPPAAVHLGPVELAEEVAALVAQGQDRRAAIRSVANATAQPRRAVYDAVVAARHDRLTTPATLPLRPSPSVPPRLDHGVDTGVDNGVDNGAGHSEGVGPC